MDRLSFCCDHSDGLLPRSIRVSSMVILCNDILSDIDHWRPRIEEADKTHAHEEKTRKREGERERAKRTIERLAQSCSFICAVMPGLYTLSVKLFQFFTIIFAVF